MVTDEFGHEVVREGRRESAFFRGLRVYLSGVAIGTGLCLGMGPPLPVINSMTDIITQSEAAAGNMLPRADIAVSAQRQAIELLEKRWEVLNRTLRQIAIR
jgi:hypothetical protein